MQRAHNYPHPCQAASIIAILRQRATLTPEAIAYRLSQPEQSATRQLTYRELDAKAQKIGAWLKHQGVGGQRALLLYPFGLEFIAGFYGCLYAGVVAVPLYPPRPNRPDARLLSVIADAQPTFALTTAKILDSLAERQAASTGLEHLQWLATDTLEEIAGTTVGQPYSPEPAELAFLQYTSGSTGKPKGVMVSHANLLHNAAMIHRAFAIAPHSKGLMWTPFYHDMGLIGGVIEPIYAGTPTTLLNPVDFLQQPLRWLRGIAEERIAVSGGPNFAYELCIDKITPEQCTGLDLSCWSVAFCGAEPVRASTLERFAAKFAPYGFRPEAFTPCLGMAESTLMTTCTPQAQAPVVITCDVTALAEHRVEIVAATTPQPSQQLVSSGRGWLDQTVCIVHPERQTRCKPGEVGEIWIAGPSVTQGYWQRPDETAATFGATLADTGEGPFLRSGDLGFLHNGDLFVTGRLKDLIIIRGRNYYPHDLEATAEQAHPALQPASTAAFSVEEDNAEQLILVAEIERTHLRTLAVDEVVTAIRSAIAQEYQLQVSAVLLLRPGRSLKTSSGKIQRRATRQSYSQGTLDAIYHWSHQTATKAQPANGHHSSLEAKVERDAEPQTAPSIERWLITHLAHRLRTDPGTIDLHKPFADYGLDSVAAVELVHELCTWLQSTGRRHTLEVTALWDFPTIAALAHHLEGGSTVNKSIAPRPLRRVSKPDPVLLTGTLSTAHDAEQTELADELAQLVRLLD